MAKEDLTCATREIRLHQHWYSFQTDGDYDKMKCWQRGPENLVINERLRTAANFLCWVSTAGESCTGNSGNGLNRSNLMN